MSSDINENENINKIDDIREQLENIEEKLSKIEENTSEWNQKCDLVEAIRSINAAIRRLEKL